MMKIPVNRRREAMYMKSIEKRNREETALLLSLVWPCVLENLTTTLVSLVDTAMVGAAGAAATAAVGLCTSPIWLMNGLARALGVGGMAMTARAVGARDRALAEYTAQQVLRTAMLLAATISLVLFFGAPIIPVLMQATPEVCAGAETYLRITSLSCFIHYTALVMGALLRSAGDMKTPMAAGIAANVINVAGNFLLIYPTRTISLFGISFVMWGADLGVAGAAIASGAGMALSGAWLLWRMAGRRSALRIRLDMKSRWDKQLLTRVLRIAAPAALERVVINGGQIIYAAMFASVGTASAAVYHIICTIEAIGYMPANGFSSAATALVGQKLGADDPDAAERIGKKSVYLALMLLCAVGVMMALSRSVLSALFTTDQTVRMLSNGLVILCGAVQPLNALSIVTQGALGGAGDTARPFVYSLLTMWGVRVPSAYLLGFVLNGGVYGIYFAMHLDLAVRSALLLGRFGRGEWKKRRV